MRDGGVGCQAEGPASGVASGNGRVDDAGMTQARIDHDSIEAFLAALAADGVIAVGVRAVSEVRPTPTPKGDGITVGRQRWVDLHGYKGGRLHALRLRDVEPGPIEADLKARGFKVRSSSDNLT